MDIMRPHVWRACGWAAIALSGGNAMFIYRLIDSGGGLHDRYAPLLLVMVSTWALLVGIRLFAPSIAKIRQELELTLGLQRRVLSATILPPAAAASPTLKLVPPLEDQPADTQYRPHASGQ